MLSSQMEVLFNLFHERVCLSVCVRGWRGLCSRACGRVWARACARACREADGMAPLTSFSVVGTVALMALYNSMYPVAPSTCCHLTLNVVMVASYTVRLFTAARGTRGREQGGRKRLQGTWNSNDQVCCRSEMIRKSNKVLCSPKSFLSLV